MLTLSFSPKVDPKKQNILIPLFFDTAKKLDPKVLKRLSNSQKEIILEILKAGNFPEKGIFPVMCEESTVYFYFLGTKKDYSSHEAREAGENVFSLANTYRLKELAIFPGELEKECVSAFQEGVVLGAYEFEEWKGVKYQEKTKKKTKLSHVQFVQSENAEYKKRLEIIFEAVKYAKDIINTPSQEATPGYLAKLAEKFAKSLKKVSVKIFGEKDLKKLGCEGILSVGKGSEEESKLIILAYSAGGKEAPIALVGKGVTFDTGGLSIKPARYMATMKQDLGGAATVLGAFYAIASSGVKKNVLAVIPTVENAVSACSYKPDDVLKMYNGVTVEVTNTDAEGRLILADALAYTEKKLSPRAMIDLATLTGACAYAVGNDFTAALTNNRKLITALKKAADETDELVWELPLHKRYIKQMKSPVADIVNSADKLKPGTIEGALFLSHFVAEKTPWCHLDIASVAFDDAKGMATGQNVRLLLELVKNL